MSIPNLPTPIHNFLSKNKEDRKIRCYMPGHKGTEHPFDITEINGADSLYEADGIIAQSERNAALLFGSEKTLYSCSGSTLAIQTMLALAKEKSNGKDHIIAGRYSHRSFINSCILLDLKPMWVYPQTYLGADISPADIEARINERTMAVFINSIDYYGGTSDIRAISDVCKKYNIPLLVDNAHGAYRKFTRTDRHPITLGADMCADSAHKTLPVLTGGAYLHIASRKFAADAKETMSLFGTSSPSYLILDSLDRFNATASNNSGHIPTLCDKIRQLKTDIASYGYTVTDSDEMRITLDCRAMFSTGFRFAEGLAQFGVECEYADEYRCVLLFGWSTSDEDLETLREIFRSGSASDYSIFSLPVPPIHIRTNVVFSPAKAYCKPKISIQVKDALNKTCASVIAPCPPGIPLVMPGETITLEIIEMLLSKGVKHISITV